VGYAVSGLATSTGKAEESIMSLISVEEFERLGREKVYVVAQFGFKAEYIEHGRAKMRAPFRQEFLRPGGTVSGPVLMSLADYAMYAAVLSMIGPVEMAVTINLNINFLKRPAPKDVIADARIIKLGKRLAVGEVSLFSEGEEDPIAHVTSTYSIPPDHVQVE